MKTQCNHAALAPSGSADFQSAVAQISNPQAPCELEGNRRFNTLPTGSRRYSRLETCATAPARSADFQSAVVRISNPQTPRTLEGDWQFNTLPTGSRRLARSRPLARPFGPCSRCARSIPCAASQAAQVSRLETCATVAQAGSLLCRELAIREPSALSPALPTARRRNSRFPICATAPARSADFQSAVARISNPQAPCELEGNRRFSHGQFPCGGK